MDLDDRYVRHRLIDGWDQDRLRSARVMVAGAGAIGNEVIKLLALLGIGHVLIVDFDVIEISNLTRSPLFRESDLGKLKAVVAAERASEINPETEVRAICGDLTHDVGYGIYRSLDVVIGCLDSLDSRLALNRACGRTRTPWLNGAIEVTVAEISLFRAGEGSCFECSMSPEMWERRRERYSCSGLRSVEPHAPMPTTAVVASLAAGYLVQEALYLIHAIDAGGGAEKEGLRYSEKIVVNLKPYETAVYKLPMNAECLAHDVFEPIEVREDTPAKTTVADVVKWTGEPGGVVELGFDLVTELQCISCQACEPMLRPIERCETSLIHCPMCGQEARRPETVNWLDANHPLSHVPLSRLSLPEHAIISVKGESQRRYFQLGGLPIWDRERLSEGGSECPSTR